LAPCGHFGLDDMCVGLSSWLRVCSSWELRDEISLVPSHGPHQG
jgi:hypothetical protein